MNIIEKLKKQYNLAPNSYLKENIWAAKFKDSDFVESAAEHLRIQQKWEPKYGDGWYGISMTDRLPVVFYKVVDEFLDWVAANNPDFEIHQIKLKMGSIRVYLGNVNKDTDDYSWSLTELLFDNKLIY